MLIFKEIKTNFPVPLAVGNYWVYKHIFYSYDPQNDSMVEDSSYEKASVLRKINKIKNKQVNGYQIAGGPLPGIYFYEDDYLWLYSQEKKIFIKFFPIKPKYQDEWEMYRTVEKAEEDLDGDGIIDSTGILSVAKIIKKEENLYEVLIWEYQNWEWHSQTKEWFDYTFPAWGGFTVEIGKGIIKYEEPVRRGIGDEWIIRKYKIKD
ncbi:MAG: hypothetical protein ABIK90_06385 [candidate division WOR-3 bacterium]